MNELLNFKINRDPFPSEFVDEHGNPVRRTKYTHPYSYDGFVLWRTEGKANDTIYSDRLLQWDFDKHDLLCEKHFGNRGQYWSERAPAKIEAFLRDWCDAPDLKLIMIMQYCNQSSGYPCWRFDFVRPSLNEPEACGLQPSLEF